MKNYRILLTTLSALLAVSSLGYASEGHSDVEFGFAEGRIDVEFGDEGAVFEGEFPVEGTDLQFTGEPGFASEIEEGMGIGPEDQLVYNVLSDLLYWNEGFKPVPSSAQIRISNVPPSPLVPDTVVGTGTGTQLGSFEPAMNRIGAAEADGDFHNDLDFFLEPKGDAADESMFGVYGFVVSLSTDADGINDSDPFAMVFNFGMNEEVFEEGVEAFASYVPEPNGLVSILGAMLCLALSRRNFRA